MANKVSTAPRYSEVNRLKSDGATYTPSSFARFVAEQILSVASLPATGTIRVLDPACGDGALLEALINQIHPSLKKRIQVIGYDTDPDAIYTASHRLQQRFPDIKIQIERKDFLEHVIKLKNSRNLFSPNDLECHFHLIIANPPYVRTQIIGAQQAQEIAQNFGLTGRVDLYYPFLLGISQVLAVDGVAGIITSNRFMTTKSGQSVRRELLTRFRISKVWDLGDTKLFDAAVLPAVLLAHGTKDFREANTHSILFTSIYETKDQSNVNFPDPLTALSGDDGAVVAVPDGRNFLIRHGLLNNGGTPEGVWRLTNKATDHWLSTVESNTWATFRRIGKIKVGVKSTADKIFIRNDWDSIPGGRPELLRPLITRKCARRFKSDIPSNKKHIKEILYPHESTANGRAAVDLSMYPKAASYLEAHRPALESRKYLIDAGRKWYELWVPHDPSAWESAKLVFPDIADKPIFWIDTDGGVVNGECYWIQCKNKNEEDLLWLALAVANSTFIEAFYDHRFNNKLYAGKRRYITQYVELFPLPNPASKCAEAIISLAKKIHSITPSAESENLAMELDAMVWDIFGLGAEKITR